MRVALCGLGRAGKQVLSLILQSEGNVYPVMCICRNGSEKAGKNLMEILPFRNKIDCPVYSVSDAAVGFQKQAPDVLIDFSSSEATMALLPVCARYGVRMVICTTNFSDEELRRIQKTANETENFGAVYAPNVTPGVNVMMILARRVAQLLPEYDYAITERHHNKKADLSATAKKIAGVLEDELNRPVHINAIRAGGYVGVHEMTAVGEYEQLTIVHESFSRKAFANGALIAAAYIQGRQGYYDMQDVMYQYLRKKGDLL